MRKKIEVVTESETASFTQRVSLREYGYRIWPTNASPYMKPALVGENESSWGMYVQPAACVHF